MTLSGDIHLTGSRREPPIWNQTTEKINNQSNFAPCCVPSKLNVAEKLVVYVGFQSYIPAQTVFYDIHNTYHRYLYFSSNYIQVIESRRMSFGTAYNNILWREEKCMHKFSWEFWREEPLGLPKLKWVGHFKINLRAIRCNGMEQIYLVEDKDEWRFLVNGYEFWISIKYR